MRRVARRRSRDAAATGECALAAEGALCAAARERLGWGAACHHAALEILGYRFNRAPDAADRRPSVPLVGWDERRDERRRGVCGRSRRVEPAGRAAGESSTHPPAAVRRLDVRAARTGRLARWRRSCRRSTARDVDARCRARQHFTRVRERSRRDSAATRSAARASTISCAMECCRCWRSRAAIAAALWFHWFAGDLPPFLSRAGCGSSVGCSTAVSLACQRSCTEVCSVGLLERESSRRG